MNDRTSPGDHLLALEDSLRWVEAFRRFSEGVLSADDPEDTLDLFLDMSSNAADADAALVFLKSVGGVMLCENAFCADEKDPLIQPNRAIGLTFEIPSPSMELLRDGMGVIIKCGQPRPQWTIDLGMDGSLMLVPVMAPQNLEGVLVLARSRDRDNFRLAQSVPASAFAMQAALANELLVSRQAQNEVELVEERSRIGRDLHDLAIQGLFATGMKLRDVQRKIREGAGHNELDNGITEALDSLDSSVGQIRSIVYQLKEAEESAGLVDMLRREASSARGHLGFAPTLIIEVDEENVTLSSSQGQPSPKSLLEADLTSRANATAANVSDDVVAVVREALANVAKHARASSVSVNVAIHGKGLSGEIVVTVVDDGKGVDPAVTRQSGLANMQRRARIHGGSFAMGAGPRGRGTSLVWRAGLT